MALIQCTHCGKSVSDTAERCIHCGKNPNCSEEEKQDEKLISYDTLNLGKQNELKNEFYKIYPKYKKYENKDAMFKKLRKISIAFIILGVALLLPLLLVEPNGENAEVLLGVGYTGLIIFLASDILDISSLFFIRANKKKTLLSTKIYQSWLKDKKGISYTVTFIGKDKKWKKYFDEINVGVEG